MRTPCPAPAPASLIGRLAGQTPDACPQVGWDVLLDRFCCGMPVERYGHGSMDGLCPDWQLHTPPRTVRAQEKVWLPRRPWRKLCSLSALTVAARDRDRMPGSWVVIHEAFRGRSYVIGLFDPSGCDVHPHFDRPKRRARFQPERPIPSRRFVPRIWHTPLWPLGVAWPRGHRHGQGRTAQGRALGMPRSDASSWLAAVSESMGIERPHPELMLVGGAHQLSQAGRFLRGGIVR